MSRSTRLSVVGCLASVVLLAACSPDSSTLVAPRAPTLSPSQARNQAPPGDHRQYGAPTTVGQGRARAYVALNNAHAGGAPLELGIALDASALHGLPGAQHSWLLALPANSPAPYKLVELDWNPEGHEPAGVYTTPHFDFHFYTITLDERNSIVPSDPEFAAKASNVPSGAYVPPFYVVPGPPAAAAVPQMGVHWLDVRAPELQNLFGRPEAYQPFTKTFIYGSWNGRFTMFEPMVSLPYLLTQPDVTTPIPVPSLYPAPGSYPSAYRVMYDSLAREYRVSMTGFATHL